MRCTVQYVKETDGNRQRGTDTKEETQVRDIEEETEGKRRGKNRGLET